MTDLDMHAPGPFFPFLPSAHVYTSFSCAGLRAHPGLRQVQRGRRLRNLRQAGSGAACAAPGWHRAPVRGRPLLRLLLLPLQAVFEGDAPGVQLFHLVCFCTWYFPSAGTSSPKTSCCAGGRPLVLVLALAPPPRPRQALELAQEVAPT